MGFEAKRATVTPLETSPEARAAFESVYGAEFTPERAVKAAVGMLTVFSAASALTQFDARLETAKAARIASPDSEKSNIEYKRTVGLVVMATELMVGGLFLDGIEPGDDQTKDRVHAKSGEMAAGILKSSGAIPEIADEANRETVVRTLAEAYTTRLQALKGVGYDLTQLDSLNILGEMSPADLLKQSAAGSGLLSEQTKRTIDFLLREQAKNIPALLAGQVRAQDRRYPITSVDSKAGGLVGSTVLGLLLSVGMVGLGMEAYFFLKDQSTLDNPILQYFHEHVSSYVLGYVYAQLAYLAAITKATFSSKERPTYAKGNALRVSAVGFSLGVLAIAEVQGLHDSVLHAFPGLEHLLGTADLQDLLFGIIGSLQFVGSDLAGRRLMERSSQKAEEREAYKRGNRLLRRGYEG